MNTKTRFLDIIYWISILFADFFILIILGFLLIPYEDNYDFSKGKIWSFESMTLPELVVYLCFISWFVINGMLVSSIIIKIYKKYCR